MNRNTSSVVLCKRNKCMCDSYWRLYLEEAKVNGTGISEVESTEYRSQLPIPLDIFLCSSYIGRLTSSFATMRFSRSSTNTPGSVPSTVTVPLLFGIARAKRFNTEFWRPLIQHLGYTRNAISTFSATSKPYYASQSKGIRCLRHPL
ncbi:hypothetical protein J6590_091325 [Homalodisca vitripennis]|nr:hypothetical protein J6590_091325 [Homalodisca vitripennis]